jgi:hypothetical protein
MDQLKNTLPEASCQGKETFSSSKLAKDVAARRRKIGKTGHAYRCSNCKKWHIGRLVKPIIKKKRRGYAADFDAEETTC